MRRNKKKIIIIISLIGILILMTAGYAAFQTNLDIKGTSKVSSNWDIRITNVTESNKGGDAENAKEPNWTDLTAYMEANLYQKGDFVEYDVTVENKGTLDAKLESIEEKIIGEHEAIKITFRGYTKGEKLYKNTSKIIKVKIEYNPEFEGTPEEGSSEVSIDLNYTQAEGGTITPTESYLVNYDCTVNGGKDCSSYNEYLSEGETVNLSKTVTKEDYIFVGWNTNKDALEGLENLQMGSEDITLYAIYKKYELPEIINVSNTTTTNSITVVLTAQAVAGIEKYEYSIDNGNTWINGGINNTYTFNGLSNENEYIVKVRVTDKLGGKIESQTTGTLKKITLPTFSDNTAQTQTTITYPAGCGSTYTCTYKYNDGTEVTTTSSNTIVTKTAPGNIVAEVTDGTNTVSSSYTVLYNNLYVSSSGNDSTGYGTIAKPYATLNKAYSMATNTATIHVMNGSTLSLTSAFKLSSTKNITIQSYGTTSTIKKGTAFSEFLIVVSNGSLTLSNIVLDGNSISDIKGGIYVETGTLNLNSGSKITNFIGNNNANYLCGTGIRIQSAATLNINGGTIAYNTGICSAAIHSTGTVIFNSGSINNNKTTSGSSSGITNFGTLTMNGGTISGNETYTNGGGVENCGTFIMKAGTISGNIAKNANSVGGGINSTTNSVLNISGGTISNNTAYVGGGILFGGKTMNLTGGTIKGNTANYNGGGMEIYNGSTMILDGVTIDSNTANNVGGGIHVGSGTTTIKNAIITNNKTLVGDGGGLRATGTAIVNITNVKISSNIAKTEGGGIFIYSNSKVTMNGGEISSNTATNNGGGVEVSGGTGHTATFILNGGVIKNNRATSANGGIFRYGNATYTRKGGTVCGNTPTNSYETHATCPAS